MSYPDELTPEFGLTVAVVLCVVWFVQVVRDSTSLKRGSL